VLSHLILLGYNFIRKDRPVGGSGSLAILVHEYVSFPNLDTSQFTTQDQTLTLLAISADVSGLFVDIFNIHIPPASASANNKSDFTSLFNLPSNDALVFGYFNAHHAEWNSSLSDPRGVLFALSVRSSNFCFLNADTPIRLPAAANQNLSSPDESLASAHLVTSLTWSTHTTLNSNYLPITVSFQVDGNPIRSRRTFTNFHKADWAGYVHESESLFSQLAPLTSCAKGEQKLREILLQASKYNLPSDYRKEFVPSLPSEASHLVCQHDELRKRNPAYPEVSCLNSEIAEAICVSTHQKWRDKLKDSTSKVNLSKVWSMLKSLFGKSSSHSSNQPITFNNNKTHIKAPSIAKFFCKQYTSVSPHKTNCRTRIVLRQLRKKHKLDTSLSPFTTSDVQRIIRQSKKSSVVSPDGLTAIHFKHLGPQGIIYLTKICTLSIQNAVWKSAIIVPILKPGKPVELSSSY
jgi:hypothetical protein